MSSPAQSIPFLVPCPVETGEPKDGFTDKETLFRIRTNFLQRQTRDPGGNGYLTDEEASWLFTTLKSAWDKSKAADLRRKLKAVEADLDRTRLSAESERQARIDAEEETARSEAELAREVAARVDAQEAMEQAELELTKERQARVEIAEEEARLRKGLQAVQDEVLMLLMGKTVEGPLKVAQPKQPE